MHLLEMVLDENRFRPVQNEIANISLLLVNIYKGFNIPLFAINQFSAKTNTL